jgi:large subunit ribosomal protein L7/L12
MADVKMTKEDMISAIEKMTVLELAELVKALEDKFGVVASAPVAQVVAGPQGAGGPAAAPVEEKTEFSVMITAVGDKKINVIKEVRALTSLGLKEAKDLVESMAKPVLENVDKKTAEAAKKKLEEAGATVVLK